MEGTPPPEREGERQARGLPLAYSCRLVLAPHLAPHSQVRARKLGHCGPLT